MQYDAKPNWINICFLPKQEIKKNNLNISALCNLKGEKTCVLNLQWSNSSQKNSSHGSLWIATQWTLGENWKKSKRQILEQLGFKNQHSHIWQVLSTNRELWYTLVTTLVTCSWTPAPAMWPPAPVPVEHSRRHPGRINSLCFINI